MTTDVRDLRRTRSPYLGYFGLSPTLSTDEKRRREAIFEKHRRDQRIVWRDGLPVWMLQGCFNSEVSVDCLCGLDSCADAKFCLKQRLAEYARRDEA
jgi:hypothetical protein